MNQPKRKGSLCQTFGAPGVGSDPDVELPRGFRQQRICLQCKRPRFIPWVGKDPLEKKTAAHSSILAWRIPWTEEPVGYSPLRHKESDMTE